jgi:Zn-dependent peptidase ImmA (M78 family)
MQIPDSVKVGGKTYKVNCVNHPVTANNQACYGTIDYCATEINISTMGNDEQTQEQTILHELLHAIEHDRDITLEDNWEAVINAFASGLHAVIKDNPNMFK